MASDEPRPKDAATAYAPLLEEQAEDLYENAPCGYVSWLLDGTVVKANATLLRWTGTERADVVGRRFQDLLTIGGRIYHETHVGPLLQMQGEVREIALELRRADGTTLPVLMNAVVRRDADGRPVLVRSTVFDARDRQSYERELLLSRQRERTARERVERLQRLTERLAAVLAAEAVGEVVVDELAGLAGITAVEVLEGPTSTGDLVHLAGAVLGDEGEDHVRRAVAERAAVFADGTGADGGGGHAEAVLPLAIDEALLGVVRVRSRTAEAFDEDGRALVLACARQAAQALERARLHRRTTEAALRAQVLADAGQALDERLDDEGRIAQVVDRLLGEVADVVAVEGPGTDGWRPAVAVPEHRGIAERVLDAVRAAGDQPIVDLTVAGRRFSCASTELCARGRRTGRLVLARALPGRPFTGEDGAFLRELGSRAGASLEIARLSAYNREVSTTLQRSLLAGDLPDDPRLPLVATYRPAVDGLEVGGDWYDAFTLDDDRIGVVVGDVVGRGIDAASTMGQLRSAIRALAAADLGPAAVLERLDRFAERVPGAAMATVAYAEVHLGSGRMRYACAGHPPPVIARPGDAAAELAWGGRSAPIGAYHLSPQRAEDETELTPGTRVVLYTDGLVERRTRGLDVQLERLVEEVHRRRDVPLPLLGPQLADGMLADQPEADDVCLLAFTYGPASAFVREVGSNLAEVAPLRADLRSWLRCSGVEGDDAHAVLLCCSEAVANAIEHGLDGGDGAVRVRAAIDADEVLLEVDDDGTWVEPGPPGDRGRGLQIIRKLMADVQLTTERGTRVVMRRTMAGGA